VEGNPALRPEKLVQADLGFRAQYELFRAGATGFVANIHDYVTYEFIGPLAGTASGLGFQFVNTDRATLYGFESYAEADVLDWLTPFATASYVRGTDQTRGDRFPFDPAKEPLPGIPPFEARLGFRVHEPGDAPRWGVETSVRLVSRQDRAALTLGEQPTPSFHVIDLRSYVMPTNYLTVSAGVENLTDEFYREHLDLRTGRGVFQPGRNFYVAAELRY
jgi:outer membrane receptor protein involved in Fe transport